MFFHWFKHVIYQDAQVCLLWSPSFCIFLNYQLSSNTISFIFWIFMIIYLDWPAIDTRPLGRTPICFFILSAKVSLSLLIIKILFNRHQSSWFLSLIVCASIKLSRVISLVDSVICANRFLVERILIQAVT